MTEDCCPRCQSQQPHLHPALQHEGEVQPCPDPFHRTVTSTNTPERIAKTDALLAQFEGVGAAGATITGVMVAGELHVLDPPIVIPPQ